MRERTRRPSGLIEPCLPRPAKKPPAGPGWIHEIKHDGFRIIARRDGNGVRLITRNGHDFSDRFPFIKLAVAALPAKSCVVDGEQSSAMTVALPSLTSSAATVPRRPRCTSPSTCSSSTARTCEVTRSKGASEPCPIWCAVRIPTSWRTSTSKVTARLFTNTRASWAARALSQSGLGRPIEVAAPSTGLRSRTPQRQR